MKSQKRKKVAHVDVKKRARNTAKILCSECDFFIGESEAFAACRNCKETFHSSCMNNYNRKQICRRCSPRKKGSKAIKVEDDDYNSFSFDDGNETEDEEPDPSEVVFMTSDFESGRFFVNESESESDINPSICDENNGDDEDPEVYEEPDTSDGEGEEIMLEIVSERLLNGWSTSSEEEEEDVELEELFTPPIAAASPQFIEEEIILQDTKSGSDIVSENELLAGEQETSVAFDIKKTRVGPNGEVTTTTQNIKWQPGSVPVTPVAETKSKKKGRALKNQKPPTTPTLASNQWLALAALNYSNMQQKKPIPAKAPVTPKPALNLSTVANAAAALMANPAALKALTELRKNQISKLPEKEKKPVTTDFSKALKSLVQYIQKGNSNQTTVNSAKAKEDEEELIFEILDAATLDNDTIDSPKSDVSSLYDGNTPDKFSRFRKIPIGTFWKSQRLGHGRKRQLLQKAIKRSPATNRELNSTLLNRGGKGMLSPQLIPIENQDINHTSIDDITSMDLPLPLTPY